MIPTYNADRYLRDALESVLAQDPGPDVMQIEVVDDGSEVDPRPIVKEIAGDRVSVHRHDRNMGHVAAFNTCIDRAQGEYVHLLHADDEVRPGFYERLGAALDAKRQQVLRSAGTSQSTTTATGPTSRTWSSRFRGFSRWRPARLIR